MDERLRFVARLLDGESMSEVCRAFGISRKIGYRIYTHYKDQGAEALCDRSRRPVRYANQLPPQVESQIVTLKQEKPHWGARKIRELLVRRLSGDIRIPAKSTIHAVLHRHGLVQGIRRPRHRAHGTPLSPGLAPNDLWCVDFKVSSSSAMAHTATRSPSPITPRATCCCAKRWTRCAKRPPSRRSSNSSSSAACPPPFAPTTVSRSPAPTPSSTFPSCP